MINDIKILKTLSTAPRLDFENCFLHNCVLFSQRALGVRAEQLTGARLVDEFPFTVVPDMSGKQRFDS